MPLAKVAAHDDEGVEMMDIAELETLIAMLDGAGLASIEIADGRQSLRLVMETGEGAGVVLADSHDPTEFADPNPVVVRAQLPGTFLVRHPLRPAPFAPIGDRIGAGDILGLVQVGPIYSPVTAPVAGTVKHVLAETPSPVQFGAPLFELTPAAAPK